jgi:RNA-directed DNA polymerase
MEHRIGDKRVLRLIQKWLKVGVLEDGIVTQSETGTGQGAVISPLLANIYLHYVFDLWAEQWRGREARGDMILVRYADDVVLGFELEADAKHFLEAMKARLEKFSLALHPEKTRLIAFGRFAAEQRERAGLGKPETFDFLGFTFISGKTRKGKFLVQRKSRRDRVRAKLREIKGTLRSKMHLPVAEQGSWLGQVVRGYFAYHAVPSNLRSLVAFHEHVINLWQRTLARRSQKGRVTQLEMTRLVAQWLPQPRIQHPWPNQRFAVKYPRWKPYAGKPHVRFCAGGA